MTGSRRSQSRQDDRDRVRCTGTPNAPGRANWRLSSGRRATLALQRRGTTRRFRSNATRCATMPTRMRQTRCPQSRARPAASARARRFVDKTCAASSRAVQSSRGGASQKA
eukprot:1394308-Pleurochrysis_carterae.AAC.5